MLQSSKMLEKTRKLGKKATNKYFIQKAQQKNRKIRKISENSKCKIFLLWKVSDLQTFKNMEAHLTIFSYIEALLSILKHIEVSPPLKCSKKELQVAAKDKKLSKY